MRGTFLPVVGERSCPCLTTALQSTACSAFSHSLCILKHTRELRVVLSFAAGCEAMDNSAHADLPDMASVAVGHSRPQCLARTLRQRLTDVSLSTDQSCLNSLLPLSALSGIQRCRLGALPSSSLSRCACVCVQRHITRRTAMSAYSTFSPPERERNCCGLIAQLHEKSVSLAAVVLSNQLAQSPQINLAACLDHPSRPRRTMPASQHGYIFSFVR
jgi:hypothetical protein